MNCPKCKMRMEVLTHAGVEIDRCTNCRGIWFDALELDELRARPGTEIVDTGHEKIGAEYDEHRLTDCPKCGPRTMIHMVDARQAHITFEQCNVCGGTFLDAGEFRDMKEETFWEMMKSLAG